MIAVMLLLNHASSSDIDTYLLVSKASCNGVLIVVLLNYPEWSHGTCQVTKILHLIFVLMHNGVRRLR
jgi:hypothetical protein